MPKPPGERVRRHLDQPHWRKLEVLTAGRVPALPRRDWLPSTRRWWKTLWTGPLAPMFIAEDVPLLQTLAALIDDQGRGLEVKIADMAALADRFGLSPKARRQLQWELDRSESAPQTATPRLRALEALQ